MSDRRRKLPGRCGAQVPSSGLCRTCVTRRSRSRTLRHSPRQRCYRWRWASARMSRRSAWPIRSFCGRFPSSGPARYSRLPARQRRTRSTASLTRLFATFAIGPTRFRAWPVISWRDSPLAPSLEIVPQMKFGMEVTEGFFSILGVHPSIGRAFSDEEAKVAGRGAAVVLGHDFWQQQFAGDTGVAGRAILINGHPFVIVGVAPEKFTGMDPFLRPAFFVPIAAAEGLNPSGVDRPREPGGAALEPARTLETGGCDGAGAG